MVNRKHHEARAKPAAAQEHIIAQRLSAAEQLCQARGSRLTARRRQILALLLKHGGCLKAYDLLKLVRHANGHAAPPSIYRSLHFLIEHGLVHRVEALNAFIACVLDDPDTHHDLIVVCPNCTRVVEIGDNAVTRLLNANLQTHGIKRHEKVVEITAPCTDCTEIKPLKTRLNS